MSSIRSIRVLCAAYFCFVLLGLCAAAGVTSITRKGDVLVMRGLFGDSLSDESKLSVSLESPTPFTGSGCISVKVSKTLIACTLQTPLATASTIKVTVSYDGVVLENADHRTISFYNSLTRERGVQCTGDEQALTFEVFNEGDAIADDYGGLVWTNMYAFDDSLPAHAVTQEGDTYTNFFNGLRSGHIVAYNHDDNGLTATWASKNGWLFNWHAYLTAAYHDGTTYDIYGYIKGELFTHQHIILGAQPHYPNVTGPADTWTVVLRPESCPPGGSQCELVMDDFSLTCVSFRDPVITVPALVRGEAYNTYDVTLTNLNAINYHITANSDCFFSDGTDFESTLTFSVGASEVDSKTIQMYCTTSQASVTATLSVGTASWSSNNYRVYVPTVSFINTQWNLVCSPLVTLNDIYSGLDVPISYVGDTSAECDFYRSSVNGVCTDQITSAETASADSYGFYMSCRRTQLQTIQIGDYSSNNFQVKQNYTGGKICGDPYFAGYDGRTFTFSGHPNRWYNVFSNQFVSVNSYFVPTNGANKNNESTVNGAVAIRTHEFNISTMASMYHPADNKVVFDVNGEKKTVEVGKTVVLGDACIKVHLRKSPSPKSKIQHTLSVQSKEFEVFVYLVQDHNQHIDAQYFDYYVSADLSNPEALGGILGATARKYDIEKLKHNARTFEATSDFSADAKTDKFEDVSICEEFHKRKDAPAPSACAEMETGFACTGNRGCVSHRCSTRKTCEDLDVCFSDQECIALNKNVAGDWMCLSTGRCFNNAATDNGEDDKKKKSN